MLVVHCKNYEAVQVGEAVVTASIRPDGKISLGISAPESCVVMREKLVSEEVKANNPHWQETLRKRRYKRNVKI